MHSWANSSDANGPVTQSQAQNQQSTRSPSPSEEDENNDATSENHAVTAEAEDDGASAYALLQSFRETMEVTNRLVKEVLAAKKPVEHPLHAALTQVTGLKYPDIINITDLTIAKDPHGWLLLAEKCPESDFINEYGTPGPLLTAWRQDGCDSILVPFQYAPWKGSFSSQTD